jgi:hypothetical protein
LNELLEFAVEAHGGLERWRRVINITARLSIGGLIVANSGWESALANIAVRIDARDQHAVLSPITGTDRRCLFTRDRVAIEANDGLVIDERFDPRASFEREDFQVAWNALQLTYFTSCALWTVLTVPFVLMQPGFETEELEPWAEDGEIWRRLRAVFPTRIASHSANQLFYFGPDGLLRRHDYRLEIVGNAATADYTDDHQVFDGISFPTLRRAVRRERDATTLPDPALLTMDIGHVTVESAV